MDSDSKVIQYIATAQPYLEKLANERKELLSALSIRLSSLIKQGCLTKAESNRIYKEASYNPKAIVKYLSIGNSFPESFGKVVSSKGLSIADPISQFANS